MPSRGPKLWEFSDFGKLSPVANVYSYDLLQEQLFPGSDHIHRQADPKNPEARYLRPTPFGESFDVLLSSATGETLRGYPVILLVGDMNFDGQFIDGLRQALHSGSKLLLHKRHAGALGKRLAQLEEAGSVEVLPSWTNPATGRPAAISNTRLAQLIVEHLPVVLEGDPIQYQVNRNCRGWVFELVHNGGVIKKPDRTAVVDTESVAHVRLRPRVSVRKARVWGSNQDLPLGQSLALTIPAGRSMFVEWVLQE